MVATSSILPYVVFFLLHAPSLSIVAASSARFAYEGGKEVALVLGFGAVELRCSTVVALVDKKREAGAACLHLVATRTEDYIGLVKKG